MVAPKQHPYLLWQLQRLRWLIIQLQVKHQEELAAITRTDATGPAKTMISNCAKEIYVCLCTMVSTIVYRPEFLLSSPNPSLFSW